MRRAGQSAGSPANRQVTSNLSNPGSLLEIPSRIISTRAPNWWKGGVEAHLTRRMLVLSLSGMTTAGLDRRVIRSQEPISSLSSWEKRPGLENVIRHI
jgi:hypothetical protein